MCVAPVYDCVHLKRSGEVIIRGQMSHNALQIDTLRIVKRKDRNAVLVRDESTARRDLGLAAVWVLYKVLSIVFYMAQEHMMLIDALYVRIVTAFTVGYGELQFYHFGYGDHRVDCV